MFTSFDPLSAPTAYRMLMKSDDLLEKFDLSSLRMVASMGEITDISTWRWLHNRFGNSKIDVLDSWWQTETGCPMCGAIKLITNRKIRKFNFFHTFNNPTTAEPPTKCIKWRSSRRHVRQGILWRGSLSYG